MVTKDIEKLLVILRKLRVISGRTRLQKIVFLLQNKDGIDLKYRFIPYYYGPYASELQIQVDILESAGLVKVIPEDGNLYVHCLTEEGKRAARDIEKKLEEPEKMHLFEALKDYKKRATSSLIREAKQRANMLP